MTPRDSTDIAEITILTALASGDPQAGLEVGSRLRHADQQAGPTSKNVISAPGQLGSTVCDSAAMRAEMEALGFVWLDEPATDRDALLTQYVRLQMPDGWELRRGSDSRQQFLHDERGVRRVSLYDVGQFWDPFCATTLIHVGGDIVTRLVYGKATADEVCWDALTADEREQVFDGLRDFETKAEQFPDIYGETAAKAAVWLAQLEARPSK